MKDIMKVLLLLCIAFAACEEGLNILEKKIPIIRYNVEKMEVKANQEFKIFIGTSYQTIVEFLNKEALKSSNTVSFIKKENAGKRKDRFMAVYYNGIN